MRLGLGCGSSLFGLRLLSERLPQKADRIEGYGVTTLLGVLQHGCQDVQVVLVFELLRFNIEAAMASVLGVQVLGDEGDLWVAKDTMIGMEDLLRITERIPLELRSQGVSLGTSLPIVPEPATLGLLGMGLVGLVLGGTRIA